MSTGFKGKYHRQHALVRFAKDLVRRSRSKCELCGQGGTRLETVEVPPLPEEPEFERCVFVCESCRRQLLDPARMVPAHWRCLNTCIWSEVPAVQVVSLRLLRRLAATERWASDLLEHVLLDPHLEAWANEAG
jgi:protein PhnA